MQTYRYLAPSALGPAGLNLQTSGGPAPNPRFFDGFLTTPRAAAAGLLAVTEVARTRYFQPLNPVSLDPVVTGGGDRLRFESFSGCCGVYARLDILPPGLDGAVLGHGTTNVDVNPPLREALARLAGLDPLRLAVGPDDLTVSTMDGAVVERKVPLPARWLRGFAEVHVLAAGFEPRAELSAADATAFLRRLPAASDRSVLWAVPSGRTLRLTSRPAPGAVCLAGAGRLAALRGALRNASGLRVFGPPVGANAGLDTGRVRAALTHLGTAAPPAGDGHPGGRRVRRSRPGEPPRGRHRRVPRQRRGAVAGGAAGLPGAGRGVDPPDSAGHGRHPLAPGHPAAGAGRMRRRVRAGRRPRGGVRAGRQARGRPDRHRRRGAVAGRDGRLGSGGGGRPPRGAGAIGRAHAVTLC
jgi:hypothetical protein